MPTAEAGVYAYERNAVSTKETPENSCTSNKNKSSVVASVKVSPGVYKATPTYFSTHKALRSQDEAKNKPSDRAEYNTAAQHKLQKKEAPLIRLLLFLMIPFLRWFLRV